MASDTLPVLSHSDFPQVFEAALDRFIVRAIVHLNFDEPEAARNVLLDALSAINFQPERLGRCAFEDEHCDCRKPAVVHLLGSDSDFCLRHFHQEVRRG